MVQGLASPALSDPRAAAVAGTRAEDPGYDLVAGVEARGFLLAAAVALEVGVGVVPIRKAGKLPRESVAADYDLEYGTGTLELHRDAIVPGQRILIVDDVLATGEPWARPSHWSSNWVVWSPRSPSSSSSRPSEVGSASPRTPSRPCGLPEPSGLLTRPREPGMSPGYDGEGPSLRLHRRSRRGPRCSRQRGSRAARRAHGPAG